MSIAHIAGARTLQMPLRIYILDVAQLRKLLLASASIVPLLHSKDTPNESFSRSQAVA